MPKLIIPSYPLGFARHPDESRVPDLWRGLVTAWLPFLGVCSKGHGGKLHDSSGRNNPGTLKNMPTPGTSTSGWTYKNGTVLAFDKANRDYVNIGTNAGLDITGQITIATWIFASSPSVSNTIFTRSNTVEVAPFHQYGFFTSANGRLYLSGDNGGTLRVYVIDTTVPSLTATKWYLVVATHDGTWSRLYVDGKEIVSDNTWTGGFVSHATWDTNIGVFSYKKILGDEPKFFGGWMDSVVVWDRSLSANEIGFLSSEHYAMWELARRPVWKLLGVTHNLTATAAAGTTTTASLSVGKTEQMSATAAAVVSTTGSLSIGVTESMTATAAAVVSTTGSLSIGVTESMTATAAAVVSTAGDLTIGATESMTATAAAGTSAAGDLTIGATESMTATAAAVVSTTGSLTVGETVSMTATAAAVTTATGRLTMLVTALSAFIRTSTEKAIGGYF